MAHQRAGGFVHLAAFGVIHPERLNGSDDNSGAGIERGRLYVQRLADAHHGDRANSRFNRLAVRMVRIGQGAQGLVADHVGRRQPEHQGVIGVQQIVGRNADGMAGDSASYHRR